MGTKTYYLPIKSANLAHYFVKGLVCPSKYISNRNEDIQNKFDSYLLLSNHKFTNATNCALELVLDEKNERLIQISEHFYLFDVPLPISRVKKVFFDSDQKRVSTTFNITSGAAFLPENLTSTDTSSEVVSADELQQIDNIKPNKDWSESVDRYNRLLGGFAMMSIAGNAYQNYPKNYFSVLGVLNTRVKEDIVVQEVNVDKDYSWAILKDSTKHLYLYNTIYSNITSATVETYADQERINLEKNNGLIQIEKINPSKNTYLVAILATFGEGARKTIDNFISDFISNRFYEDKKEGIALIFGINKGYDSFRNLYKTPSFEVATKFKLDSQLDYYTIESIFQYSFFGKTDSRSFPYLDAWCPILDEPDNIDGFETYKVLDKTIISKKKEKDLSYSLFQTLFQNISRDKIYQILSNDAFKSIPPYIHRPEKKEIELYFSSILDRELEQLSKSVFESTKAHFDSEYKSRINETINKHQTEIANLRAELKSKEELILKLEAETNDLTEELQTKLTQSLRTENENNSKPTLNPKPKKQDENPTLFEAPASSTDNAQLLDKEGRKGELQKLAITKLRAEGKKVGLHSKYENNLVDREKLINDILNKEFSAS